MECRYTLKMSQQHEKDDSGNNRTCPVVAMSTLLTISLGVTYSEDMRYNGI